MIKTFKIYSLGNFQIYNTVLLTIVTMLLTKSHDSFVAGSLYLLTTFTHFTYLDSELSIQRKIVMKEHAKTF